MNIDSIKNGIVLDHIRAGRGMQIYNSPRCITSVEQEIDHVFKLTDREHQVYRCIYCESKLKK